MTEPTEQHKAEVREIAPCPLCGRKSIVEEFRDGDDPQPLFVVTCEVCPVKTYDQFSASDAIAIWNTRAASRDTEVREVLEELSKVLTFEHGPSQRCWCSAWVHTPACLAARALWEKLQPLGGNNNLTL